MTVDNKQTLFSDTMTGNRNNGLFIFVAAILSVVPIVDGALVRFEQGYSYQYQYQANVTLEQVDTFQSAAEVCLHVYIYLPKKLASHFTT